MRTHGSRRSIETRTALVALSAGAMLIAGCGPHGDETSSL